MKIKGLSATRGFTLVEAMLVVVVVGIVGVGAGIGLGAISRGPSANETELGISNALMDKVEVLKGTAFASLASGSDTVTVNGATYTRSWTVGNANPDGLGTKTDFDLMSVSIGSHTVSTWITQP